MDLAVVELCQCPRCGGALEIAKGGPRCGACGTEFPLVEDIPCLFTDPQRRLADRLPGTRKRLETLRAANRRSSERLITMLSAAGLAPEASAKATESDFNLI